MVKKWFRMAFFIFKKNKNDFWFQLKFEDLFHSPEILLTPRHRIFQPIQRPIGKVNVSFSQVSLEFLKKVPKPETSYSSKDSIH